MPQRVLVVEDDSAVRLAIACAGDMPLAVQAKLLRVLETREVRPVGATKTLPVDVRIVAATHRDLLAEIEAQRFRDDLYYRCAVIEVEIPPLRGRPDDIPPLARHFLDRIAAERDEPPRTLSGSCVAHLMAYRWPGNGRELRNAMEHAATMGDATLDPEDLPARIRTAAPTSLPTAARRLTLGEVERRHVLEILTEVGGDRRRAAAMLDIDLSTLYRKLARWAE